MNSACGYRWGSLLFGLVALCCLAALPRAIACCSQFSGADVQLPIKPGQSTWEAGITPVAVALLDWPMGFRLLLMTLVAALICLAACLTGLLVVPKEGDEPAAGTSKSIARLLLASLMTGVLYILAVYGTGFLGYVGPANFLWMAGVPTVMALITWPRPRGVLFAVPVGIGGWIATIAICIAVGIPLD